MSPHKDPPRGARSDARPGLAVSLSREPVDPDIDLHIAQQRGELPRAPWVLLGAIAVGGALGALARYGLSVALPHARSGFPWSTFLTNVSGCLLLGALMVFVTELPRLPALTRPFLGVGVLGGYTTFSTAVVDTRTLAAAGATRTALLYLLGTLVTALAASLLGTLAARAALGRRRGARTGEPTGSGAEDRR